ncbi:NHLP bacteriocin system secretion protein [Hyella patelloides LEGE 07179]|uniref:NHLP bacteriocin system secretion protein n=1 Tax=Hyella patelloides LEGE 07179 TaxID=945734 RepID=A0A563VVN4_9CYAN|nr:NHLP bacteriocin system secretion protein [Hyella patelloides]VEP15465.1 NHLP bacteriocin system secretion protein [Hyella patelloides LEGE 07179]
MPKNNKMFRQEALERLSSPEKLDQTLKVVNPQAWLPLATAGSLVLVAVLWSIFGRIPLTANGQGVLIQPRRVVSFQSPSDGQVVDLKIESGEEIKKGDVLGTISQPALEQQLEQEKNKLAQLQKQDRDSGDLQNKQVTGERESLRQQKNNLEESLQRAEIERDLRDRGSASLDQNRASLQERIAQGKQLIPRSKARVDKFRNLFRDKLITEDILFNAEREYFDSLARLSELETQLKQLDVEETNIEREYLQSLNQIDDLKNQIQEIDTQLAQVDREDLQTSFDRKSEIQEVKNSIAQMEGEITGKSRIVSKHDGKVLEVAAVPGQIVSTGARIGSIEIATQQEEPQLVGVAYFADSEGKKIEPGMNVQITPSIVKRERHGGMLGEVTRVSDFPVTPEDMSVIIGNQNLAEDLVSSLGGNAPIQVFTKLKSDTDSVSGYQWSSSDGPPVTISPGTTAQIRVQVGKVAPIAYVIPLFRSLTGIY